MNKNALFTQEEIDTIINNTNSYINLHHASYNKEIKRMICKTIVNKETIDSYKSQKCQHFNSYISLLLKHYSNDDLKHLIDSHNNYYKLMGEILSRYTTNAAITEKLFNGLFFSHNQVINFLNETLNSFEFTRNQVDELTQTWNRTMFLSIFENEFKKSKRTLEEFSLVFFDIDHFKEINDTYGHDAGDYILKNTATIVKDSLRVYDNLGRWGGEEFLILLPKTKLENAHTIVQRIQIEINKNIFFYNNQKIQITCSFGIAQFDDDFDYESIITKADKLMYQAKNEGRNNIQVSLK